MCSKRTQSSKSTLDRKWRLSFRMARATCTFFCIVLLLAFPQLVIFWLYDWMPTTHSLEKEASDAGLGKSTSGYHAVFEVSNYNVRVRKYPSAGSSTSTFTKVKNLRIQLQSALDILFKDNKQIPNHILFKVSLRSDGVNDPEIACIARGHPSMQCVMLPSAYIGNLTLWEAEEKSLHEKNFPLEKKAREVFYRGRCAPGAESRFKLMSIESKYLNVGWQVDTKPSCLKLFTTNKELVLRHMERRRPFVDEEQFTRYLFLLNMPGSSKGSYSRHINRVWNKGSVVLLWDSPAMEWYYSHLREGLTHITVNEDNLIEKVTSLVNANRTTLETLAFNANNVFSEYLSASGITQRWVEVLQHFQKR